MKTELKAKFLQHLNQKKQEEGFTLIELLVVIIIIGILAAIALPSFLNQANKAKQSEAKSYVGSMNRAQQAYFLEKGTFTQAGAAELGKLGLGIKTDTKNYFYKIVPEAAVAGNITKVTNQGESQKTVLKSYIGGVQTGTVTGTGEATTLAVLCEKDTPGVGAEKATFGAEPDCPKGTYTNLAQQK